MTDLDPADWIAKRREKAERFCTSFGDTEGVGGVVAIVAEDLPRALDALEAVLEPHQLHEVPGGQRWCLHCGGDWPCPTVDAAETALRADS